MKHSIIILLLILSSCKNNTKSEIETENEIDQTVYEMWNDFTESKPEFKNKALPDSWYFHDNKKDANRLAELVLIGKKKATTSGLFSWYVEANADLPKVGTKHIITDFDGKARAIIEITKVDTIPFNQISKEHAVLDMGTTIEPLKKWRKAHWDFFENIMKESGAQPTEEMLLVLEKFEIIWTGKSNGSKEVSEKP